MPLTVLDTSYIRSSLNREENQSTTKCNNAPIVTQLIPFYQTLHSMIFLQNRERGRNDLPGRGIAKQENTRTKEEASLLGRPLPALFKTHTSLRQVGESGAAPSLVCGGYYVHTLGDQKRLLRKIVGFWAEKIWRS